MNSEVLGPDIMMLNKDVTLFCQKCNSSINEVSGVQVLNINRIVELMKQHHQATMHIHYFFNGYYEFTYNEFIPRDKVPQDPGLW